MFPELGEVGDEFVEPDLIVDSNIDDLRSLAKHEFDFYITNHFIEHLVNPIRFSKELKDVMKLGSVLFLTVPVKEYTFDRNRNLTTNDHLWRDYLQDEKMIGNAYLRDFLCFKDLVVDIHPQVVSYF
ncbi:methyltransferase domain-containing protein [Pseudomonadota bacterium]